MPKRVQSAKLDADKYPPAITPQAAENQLVAMAYETARNRFLDGTATAQEIVYFLKLGSPKSRIELANLEAQNQLLAAKTDSIATEKNIETLYKEAVKAMSIYKGETPNEEDVY